MLKKVCLPSFLATALWVFALVQADEGMWLFNQLPETRLKDQGFTPTQEWKDHLMRSSVRFNNGGSGSIVSSDGLVLTNHHVASDTIDKLSTKEHNYVEEGFLAKSREAEIRAPDLEINQLVSIEDVTDKVNANVQASMDAAAANAARKSAISEIERASLAATGLRSDVVTLYQGGAYHLYRYKRYTDVRLVFAPEMKIAFFGGDADNFEYPRYNLDMTIFRLYENGVPVKTKDFLKWSAAGPKENELVFVSGHPGLTNRLFSLEALAFYRDVELKARLEYTLAQENALELYEMKGKEQKRQAKTHLKRYENRRKVLLGQRDGLQDNTLFAQKQREENRLRAWVNAEESKKEVVAAWQTIAAARKKLKPLMVKYLFLERMSGDQAGAFDSSLYEIARALVRLEQEDRKPSEQRLPEYSEASRLSLERKLFSPAPIYPGVEVAKLSSSLAQFADAFGYDHALVQKVLDGKSPKQVAEKAVAESDLFDVKVRRLFVQDKELLRKSRDPFIQMARSVDKQARAIRKKVEELQEVEKQAYALIAQERFKLYGQDVAPDATFTLRLSWGRVRGYSLGEQEIPAWTTLKGVFERESQFEAEEPWQLPKSWQDKKTEIRLETPFNFVSTADIIGGNSGSPVVNEDLELVGLIFDGNIESLKSNYIYSEAVSRAVSVHSAGMLEALRSVYEAAELVKELGN